MGIHCLGARVGFVLIAINCAHRDDWRSAPGDVPGSEQAQSTAAERLQAGEHN